MNISVTEAYRAYATDEADIKTIANAMVHVLVPRGSDNDDYLHRTREFIDALSSVEKVEVLPYHTLGVPKYQELGISYRLEGVESPTQERIENAKKILGAI